jgi:hypothetical protein
METGIRAEWLTAVSHVRYRSKCIGDHVASCQMRACHYARLPERNDGSSFARKNACASPYGGGRWSRCAEESLRQQVSAAFEAAVQIWDPRGLQTFAHRCLVAAADMTRQ